MEFLIVGIPESSRVAGFRDAARAAGCAEPRVVSWMEVLGENALLPPPAAAWVRLESPGRNWNTERRLLEMGAAEEEDDRRFTRVSRAELAAISESAGRVIAMRQWYLGWKRALSDLSARWPGANFFSPPEDIAVLFDKELCQHLLETGGCPMPRSLGVPAGFEDLLDRMRTTRTPRVFLKACHGSSASGVIALETSRDRIHAFSTVALFGDGQIFNVRPVREYRDLREIIAVVNAVCRERAQAQAWVPKMGWRGKRTDLRIVTIAGRARHAVVRMSDTPMTNLQLRNTRGDLAAFAVERAGEFAAAQVAAEKAAACFPRCLALGVDVAISPDGRAWVLVANAFGDLLPGCLVDGWDAWRWQIEALRQRGYVSATGR